MDCDWNMNQLLDLLECVQVFLSSEITNLVLKGLWWLGQHIRDRTWSRLTLGLISRASIVTFSQSFTLVSHTVTFSHSFGSVANLFTELYFSLQTFHRAVPWFHTVNTESHNVAFFTEQYFSFTHCSKLSQRAESPVPSLHCLNFK